jgi:hypothetical protein
MFSTNQLIFAICFFIAFVAIIIVSYKKDKRIHKKYFRGNIWILVGFLVFVGALLFIKTLLKQ